MPLGIATNRTQICCSDQNSEVLVGWLRVWEDLPNLLRQRLLCRSRVYLTPLVFEILSGDLDSCPKSRVLP